jgi:predicted methyltransferase
MKAKVIEQEGQTLVVELEGGVKRMIKIDRAVDLRGKEVFLVREGGIFPTVQLSIKHTWKRYFWE